MESRKRTTKNVRKPKKATSKIRSLIIMAIIIIAVFILVNYFGFPDVEYFH